MSDFLFIVLLIQPIVSAAYLIYVRKKEVSTWLLFATISSILFYLVMTLSIKSIRLDRNREIAKYDLNNNGLYSQEELTPEANAALDNWASDTGLNLAPVTSLFIAPIYSGFWHLVLATPFILITTRRKNQERESTITKL